MRYANLYRSLSEYCDVELITSTDFGARFEEVWHTPTMRERRFPKDDAWHRAFRTLNEAGVEGDLSGLAFALAVSEPNCALRCAAIDAAASADFVIHEFPYSEPIFRDLDVACEIYNSHNFELGLLSSIVFGAGTGRCFEKLLRLERNLATRAARVFATSELDKEKFRLLYGVPADRLRCCPNGYAEADAAPIEAARRRRPAPGSRRPNLLFLGSSHHPNVEAAQFVLELAAALPECDVTIAGGVSKRLPADRPGNVTVVGPFDERERRRLLEQADLFLNPVTLGSGTSLKAVEALASFLPMVATPEGVRGLVLESGRQAILCERSGFATAVRNVLAQPERLTDLAERGLAHAQEHFSWTAIARRFVEDLDALRARPKPPAGAVEGPRRKFVVALNDYAVGKERSGGAVRMTEMHRALGAEIVQITFGSRFDVAVLDSGELQLTICKSAEHLLFENSVNEGRSVSVNDIVSALFTASYHLLDDILAHLVPRCDAVIFEHCYMAPALDFLQKQRPDLPIVYSAHNIEAQIKEGLLREHPLRAPLIQFVQDIEQRLAAAAALIVTCTEADAAYFARGGARTLVIPNGCLVPAADTELRGAAAPKRVGFLGSAHPPNVDAAWHICMVLVPIFEDVVFEFVGGVCDAMRGWAPANVVLHGMVDDRRKAEILGGWCVALNPLELGGGSSLKLPDYMAHGLASISTPLGARGFPVVERDAGIVVERSQFPDALRALLADDARCREIGRNALDYARHQLSWPVAVEPYREWLEGLAATPSSARAPSLLVVTYRYTEPALGGAEEYLIEVLKRLRPRFRQIELAATDVVGALTNRHHFGCGFTPGPGAARVLGELFDQVRLFPPDEVPERVAFAAARRLERARMDREHALYGAFAAHLETLGKPTMLGGFYWPEQHDGKTSRWTGSKFAFLLPATTRMFRLAGWTPDPKTLTFSELKFGAAGSIEAVELQRQSIAYEFSCTIAFDTQPSAGTALLCEVEEHFDEADHRPLGVLVREAAGFLRGAASAPVLRGLRPAVLSLEQVNVDLDADIEAILRTEQFERWIERLHLLSKTRSDAEEHDFAMIRGPHSESMQDWIAQHAAAFDTVLVQGIPFDTIPRTVETLKRLDAPPHIVLLPHFHGDDGFYYWRRYTDSFARADRTLFFSESFATRLGDPARNAVVPGGGVKYEEEAGAAFVARFRAVHAARNPFFLVLGRKAESKGYWRVVTAVAALRAAGLPLDLVMIGPDDDGCPVSGEGIHYYGRQPRDVVLGALSACLCLVTMSYSESFGIVLCEAWKFGKPVIANRACYSFRGLIRDGENGLLVATDAELFSAMRRVAGDAALRTKLGRSGYDQAIGRFTWQRVADNLHEALVVGGRR